MEFSRLTRAGLIVAAIGWTLLLLHMAISAEVGQAWRSFGLNAPNLSVVTASNNVIVSGFALAILGALQSGFGALQRFFEAVLQRSQRAQSAPVIQHPTKLCANDVAEEGWIGNRAYVLFTNGTVQIETLLGVRNFASFAEAREFIGS